MCLLCNIAVHFLGIFIKTQSKEVLCYGSVERRTHESTQKQEEESTCIYYGLRMCRCRLKQTPGTEATEAGELKQGRKQDSHCCQAAVKSEGGDGRAADPGAKKGPALPKKQEPGTAERQAKMTQVTKARVKKPRQPDCQSRTSQYPHSSNGCLPCGSLRCKIGEVTRSVPLDRILPISPNTSTPCLCIVAARHVGWMIIQHSAEGG